MQQAVQLAASLLKRTDKAASPQWCAQHASWPPVSVYYAGCLLNAHLICGYDTRVDSVAIARATHRKLATFTGGACTAVCRSDWLPLQQAHFCADACRTQGPSQTDAAITSRSLLTAKSSAPAPRQQVAPARRVPVAALRPAHRITAAKQTHTQQSAAWSKRGTGATAPLQPAVAHGKIVPHAWPAVTATTAASNSMAGTSRRPEAALSTSNAAALAGDATLLTNTTSLPLRMRSTAPGSALGSGSAAADVAHQQQLAAAPTAAGLSTDCKQVADALPWSWLRARHAVSSLAPASPSVTPEAALWRSAQPPRQAPEQLPELASGLQPTGSQACTDAALEPASLYCLLKRTLSPRQDGPPAYHGAGTDAAAQRRKQQASHRHMRKQHADGALAHRSVSDAAALQRWLQVPLAEMHPEDRRAAMALWLHCGTAHEAASIARQLPLQHALHAALQMAQFEACAADSPRALGTVFPGICAAAGMRSFSNYILYDSKAEALAAPQGLLRGQQLNRKAIQELWRQVHTHLSLQVGHCAHLARSGAHQRWRLWPPGVLRRAHAAEHRQACLRRAIDEHLLRSGLEPGLGASVVATLPAGWHVQVRCWPCWHGQVTLLCR